MPIFFLIIGVLLVVVGINNKLDELGELVKDDFTPANNVAGFQTWLVALFVVGSLGYVRALRPVANSFLVLIIISLMLSNKGFFAKFNQAVKIG